MKRMLPEERVLAVLVIAMVLMVAAQILSRYFLHTSLSHTEELVRYLFIWATFVGAAGAVSRGRHMSLSTGLGFLHPRLKRAAARLSFACAFAFCLVVLYYGVRVVYLEWITGQTTAALGLPMWTIGLAVPAGMLIFLIRLVMSIRKTGRSDT
jgi:TRAP-type C4-dicarboxylate transport system permease small subunit